MSSSAPPTSPQRDFTNAPNEKTILGHPVGLFLLFAVEMWERFSYYGMRGLLVLYLIGTMSASKLEPGVYTNQIEFTTTKKVDDKVEDVGSRLQTFTIAVDGTAGYVPPTDTVTAKGAASPLSIVRAKKVTDPAKPDEPSWVPDEATPADSAVALVGKGKTFTNDEVAFIIRNPTAEPVQLRLGVVRTVDGKPQTPYFRVNGSSTSVAAEIKPDSALKPDEKPFVAVVTSQEVSNGRFWQRDEASTLYGWYTGLAYLFPILGGIIADKLIGTHRSMVVGGLLISIGHIILGFSGMGELDHNATGMSLFIMGLAVIVLGTGHFKPTVSVMVGQLYPQGDPRRDGAFTIFYMGINLGAFLCAFVCGTLGEKVGWHWGFGSAAVGMILGLLLYLWGRPQFLSHVGEPPEQMRGKAGTTSAVFLVGSLVVSAAFALAYHYGATAQFTALMNHLQANPTLGWGVVIALAVTILGWIGWFLSTNRPEDRGPVITIFVFMFFNAFFWLAFEQAGSSVNVFTEQNTDRMMGTFEVPATWFQSVNAGLIFILAPIFAGIWTKLGKVRMNPSQPVKIALGLIFLGLGFLFMVWAGKIAVGGAAKAGMWLIFMTYFWHTVGELCLSPTGLSYVTKAAPVKFVSLLMGIWFVSSFIANLGGGLVAAQVEAIERGELKLPWNFGGQADFFFLFVVTSIGAGVVILILSPLLKKLMRSPID